MFKNFKKLHYLLVLGLISGVIKSNDSGKENEPVKKLRPSLSQIIKDYKNGVNKSLLEEIDETTDEQVLIKKVEGYLTCGANPHSWNELCYGIRYSPFILAIKKNRGIKVIVLLMHGGQITKKDLNVGLLTALECANDKNVLKHLVKLFLDKGANPNANNKFENNTHFYVPLTTAIKFNRDIEIIEMLLDAGADPNHGVTDYVGSALFYAIKSGNKQLIKLLEDSGALRSKMNPTAWSVVIGPDIRKNYIKEAINLSDDLVNLIDSYI